MTRPSSRTPTPTAMNRATHGGASRTTRPPLSVTNLSSTYSSNSRADRKNAWSLRHSPTPRVALSTRADIDASTACASLPRLAMARMSSRTPGLSLKYSTPSRRSFKLLRFNVGRRNQFRQVRRPAGVTHASAASANNPHSLPQPTYCDGWDSRARSRAPPSRRRRCVGTRPVTSLEYPRDRAWSASRCATTRRRPCPRGPLGRRALLVHLLLRPRRRRSVPRSIPVVDASCFLSTPRLSPGAQRTALQRLRPGGARRGRPWR